MLENLPAFDQVTNEPWTNLKNTSFRGGKRFSRFEKRTPGLDKFTYVWVIFLKETLKTKLRRSLHIGTEKQRHLFQLDICMPGKTGLLTESSLNLALPRLQDLQFNPWYWSIILLTQLHVFAHDKRAWLILCKQILTHTVRDVFDYFSGALHLLNQVSTSKFRF